MRKKQQRQKLKAAPFPSHWSSILEDHFPLYARLEEERPYWEQYFDLLNIKDAHARKNCRDVNGIESWACCDCDCTRKLERKLQLA